MCVVCQSEDMYDSIMNDHMSRTSIRLDAEHGRIEVVAREGATLADCIALFCPICGRDLRGKGCGE